MIAIFAVNALNGFGQGKTMPWSRSPADLKRFKNFTDGFTVVMGAGTWNSDIPKPFPNRRNIVLSTSLNDNRCEVYRTIDNFLENISKDEKVFVIGGAKMLWELRPHIDKVYLTTFTKSFDKADVVFDTSAYLKDFELRSGEILNDHKFEIYKKSDTIKHGTIS